MWNPWVAQQVKRKSDELDCKPVSTLYAEAVNSPFHTPVSGKVAKTAKTSRAAKSNRLGPQAPAFNAGQLTILIWTSFYDPTFYSILKDIDAN